MKMKKALAALALTGALSSVAGGAIAATQYPIEGGTWNYGFTGVDSYSDYYHGARCHGATVINDWGTSRSVNTSAGYWANARIGATLWTNNSYYYRVC